MGRQEIAQALYACRTHLVAAGSFSLGINLLYLAGALLTSVWAPGAFTYALGGLLVGCLLGFVGLALSRWETTSASLHYTPNRWLVLAITLIVSARLLYGFWRGWQAWRFTPEDSSWLAAAGAAGSLGAGGIVLGYYLTYWFGVRRRVRRYRQMSVHPTRRV